MYKALSDTPSGEPVGFFFLNASKILLSSLRGTMLLFLRCGGTLLLPTDGEEAGFGKVARGCVLVVASSLPE
jgi:hypothetical protein